MDFSDALRAMKDGKRVRRAIWSGGAVEGVMGITTLTTPEGAPVRVMAVYKPDGRVFAFGGSQWDILSDDWEVAG